MQIYFYFYILEISTFKDLLNQQRIFNYTVLKIITV